MLPATQGPKILKSCDQCKARKVRCIRDDAHDTQSPCRNCKNRNEPCHHSYLKARRPRRPRSQRIPDTSSSSRVDAIRMLSPITRSPDTTDGFGPSFLAPPTPTNSRASREREDTENHNLTREPSTTLTAPVQLQPSNQSNRLPNVYIDRLLADQISGGFRAEELPFTGYDYFGTSSSIAYFSEKRIRSLNSCLANNKLVKLFDNIAKVIDSRMRGIDKVPSSKASTDRVTSSALIPGSKEELYIKAYFEHVHPIYPFLDQEAFQTRASSLQHSQVPTDKAWPALYHAVLALGCQYHDGGSFEPWRGEAWRYFEVSLSLAPDLLIIKPSLMTVQAFTAMAVFSLTISCMQIEATMVSEGAKMAQALRLNKVKDDITSARTFWVLYWMEKTSCFYGGRGSVLMDSDVGCPIPHLPETILDGFNWFLAFCRYARLLSKMYEFLFTVNANVNTPALYWITIDHLKEELERWRLSIPPPFRPGDAFRTRELSGSMAMSIALRLHFSYHNALLAFSRVTFHVGADEPPSSERMRESKTCMIKSARCILELTKFIDVEAYTPLWILAIMPISALFILFELVVHNPNHPETDSNLALLDVASGHFSRLEYESNGSLPGSLIAEFAHLARQHVRDVQEQQRESSTRRRVSTTELSSQEMTLPIIQQGAYLPGTMTEHDPQQGLLPVESDTLFFPIFDEPRYPNQALPPGIDIMDLFDSTMPVFPFFSNGE